MCGVLSDFTNDMNIKTQYADVSSDACSVQAILQLLQDGDSWEDLRYRAERTFHVSPQRLYELTNACISGGSIRADFETQPVRFYRT